MRGIEDTAFIWGGFDFDNIGPVLLEGRPFPNLDRRQPKADGLLGRGWNYRGELLGFHGVVFQASSGMCVGGLQLRGATEGDEPGTLAVFCKSSG